MTYPATISACFGSDQATAVGCKRVSRSATVIGPFSPQKHYPQGRTHGGQIEGCCATDTPD